MESTRRYPYSQEAENYVIGCILLDSNVATEVFGKLNVSDFHDEVNKKIIGAIYNLFENNKKIEAMTISEELKRLDTFDAVGGMPRLVELLDSVPSVANVETYLEIIKEKALERELLEAAKEISENIMRGRFDFLELLDRSEQKIMHIVNKRHTSPLLKIDIAADKVFDRMEGQITDQYGLTGLDTGFSKLNELTHGLQNGELTIIAARPGVGKSAFALNLATNACRNVDAHVAFFSLEMSIDQLVMRMFSSLSAVPLDKIRSNQLSETQMAMLLSAKQDLSKYNLYLDDSYTSDIGDIRAKCKKLKREGNLDLIIIDYLQLLSVADRRSNRVEEVSQISRGLKLLAMELDVPVVALSQMSRAVESRTDKKPILADLRESGSIEQDADIVIFLSREQQSEKERFQSHGTKIELIIAKNRQGMLDNIDFIFKGAYSSFVLQDEGPN